MSNEDANDYNKLKKALLIRYSFTEDGYRWRFQDVKAEKKQNKTKSLTSLLFNSNYLAKWLELYESSPGKFDALVDFIVKKQFI